jgi:hypothetical protein
MEIPFTCKLPIRVVRVHFSPQSCSADIDGLVELLHLGGDGQIEHIAAGWVSRSDLSDLNGQSDFSTAARQKFTPKISAPTRKKQRGPPVSRMPPIFRTLHRASTVGRHRHVLEVFSTTVYRKKGLSACTARTVRRIPDVPIVMVTMFVTIAPTLTRGEDLRPNRRTCWWD